MFFPGTPNVFVPSDSVFMLFKCMCNNISIEKKTWKKGQEKKSDNDFFKHINFRRMKSEILK